MREIERGGERGWWRRIGVIERNLWRSKRGGRGGLVWRRELLLEREVGKEDGGGGLVGSREGGGASSY